MHAFLLSYILQSPQEGELNGGEVQGMLVVGFGCNELDVGMQKYLILYRPICCQNTLR